MYGNHFFFHAIQSTTLLSDTKLDVWLSITAKLSLQLNAGSLQLSGPTGAIQQSTQPCLPIIANTASTQVRKQMLFFIYSPNISLSLTRNS